jgi:hypothetical protein
MHRQNSGLKVAHEPRDDRVGNGESRRAGIPARRFGVGPANDGTPSGYACYERRSHHAIPVRSPGRRSSGSRDKHDLEVIMANEKGPNVKKKQKCKNCEGKGLLKKGDKVVKCQRCGGTGLR